MRAAAGLHVSQPRVSRLLKRAVEEGIVRTVVTAPEGTHLAGRDRAIARLPHLRGHPGRPALRGASPGVQVKATRLIDLLARVTGAEPVFFPSPAVLGSAAAAEQLMRDPGVGRVMMLLPTVTIALMGIGSLEPSALLRESGNMTTAEDAVELRAEGAVCSMAPIRR